MKSLKKSYFFLILVLFIFIKSSIAQEWLKEIQPLQTKVSELNEILAITPEKKPLDTLFFKLKEGNLFVEYSLGNCISGSWGAWNVEEGTVISITFYPNKKRKPSFFGFSGDGMKQGYDSGHLTYKSDDTGLYYSTQFGKVMSIMYTPPQKYEKIRCKT